MVQLLLAVASDVSSIEETLMVESVMLSNDDIMARVTFEVSQQNI